MRTPVQDLTNIPGPADYRAHVERLERMALGMPQVGIPTEHVISGGMYARTITIPAGTVLTGAAHKTDHLCVCMGDIEVLTDDGPKRLTGLHVLATKAGVKRAGYTHGPTRWTTICRTDCTDVQGAEDELVERPETLQTRNQLIDQGAVAQLED
jgi:hypothetical protein